MRRAKNSEKKQFIKVLKFRRYFLFYKETSYLVKKNLIERSKCNLQRIKVV